MKQHDQQERRSGADRRAPVERRAGSDRRRDRDREIARALPDEFAQIGGEAEHRAAGLVNRHWPERDAAARQALCQRLLPILQDLLAPGVPVTDDHRGRCEEEVLRWTESLQL